MDLMKHASILLLFMLVTSMAVRAQHAFVGKVTDGQRRPLEFATAALYDVDSTLRAGSVTDRSGAFRFDAVRAGKYVLEVRLMGFQTLRKQVDIGADPKPVTIELQESAVGLGEVTVTGRKPYMTLKDDRFVYHVDNTVISNVGNATDVLRRTPYIITDIDGSLSIAGRDKTLILIDNKPISNMNELQLLNSSRIRQVEIIENPSAKYEAEGHAVINIITRKGLGQGLNGALTLKHAQGKRGNTQLVPELAFDGRKFRIYVGANADIGGKRSTDETLNHYKKEAYEYHSLVNDASRNTRRAVGYTFAAYCDFDDKNELNAYVDGYDEHTDSHSASTRHVTKNGAEQPSSSLSEDASERPNQYAAGLNFHHRWGDAGGKLALMSNYTRYATRKHGDLEETNRTTSNAHLMQSDFDNRYDLYSLKMDAHLPAAWLGGSVELGGKYSDVSSLSHLLFKRCLGEVWQVDRRFTNDVDFREQILAAYALATGRAGRFDYSLSLRGELTRTQNELSNGRKDDRNLQLFPHIALGYTTASKQQYRLTFSRRISRPGYAKLNNSMIYIDSLSTRHGNPQLKPTIFNTISANFSHGKRLFGGLSYSYIEFPTDLMYINDPVQIERYTLYADNVKNIWSASIHAGSNINVRSWWHSQFSASFSYSPVTVVDDGVEYTFKFPAYYLNCINRFSLPRGWDADFNAKFYRPAKGMRKRRDYVDLDLGLSKKMLQNHLTVQGAIHYAFFPDYQLLRYSYKYQSNVYDYNSRFLLQVSLRYDFGSKKASRKVESSSADEVKRF